jgi:aconitate hydratase 2/2-methylisocitrate dehydratase
MTTVGSQDTTGPMTRDELKDLACLGFSADLVMQSFCHTAAYPKLDVKMHRELPSFISTRGGVSLRPGDGVIHSWLNRLLLPDTVGTGGDSHTRFPIGISFPAGSGLVSFAATGVMPLDMPESVLVRFKGRCNRASPCVTWSTPSPVRHQGRPADRREEGQEERLLRPHPRNRRSARSEGRTSLRALRRRRRAFRRRLRDRPEQGADRRVHALQHHPDEVDDRRRLRGCPHPQAPHQGHGRLDRQRHLLQGDANAQYAAVIEIDLAEVTEPILACPNDPDDVKVLSEVAGDKIDEVFIGSCMTNIGHFRAAGKVLEGKSDIPTRLWIAPPTKMDALILTEEGYYGVLGKSGARMEMPGCSLCMGNQAQIRKGSTAISTSTRNFPNRLGIDTRVYLGSAELAAMCALAGRIVTKEEYMEQIKVVNAKAAEIYRYMNFDQIPAFTEVADTVEM